jgi:hypothetical protein
MKGVAGLRHGMLPKQQKATLLVIELRWQQPSPLLRHGSQDPYYRGDGGTRLIHAGYVTAGVISQKSVRSLSLEQPGVY